ncbi:MAG: TRAP transporter large permease [Bacteroidota bacterium]
MDIAIVFGVLVLLMVIGVPVAFSLGLSALLAFYLCGAWDIVSILSQRMYFGSTSFVLLAIPFYILAAQLMNTSGMSRRIADFSNLLVGKFRGGLAQANIVNSMVFAGMSGSSVADASGIGMIEIEMMTAAGYDKKFSASVTAASATIGPIIPPSIPLVVFGAMASVSVGRLFLGGFIPGVLMGIGMMVAVYFIAVARDYPRIQIRLKGRELLTCILDGLAGGGCLLILMGGILSGVFTPTEAAVVACLYAFILGFFVYKDLKFSDLPVALWETVKSTISVLFVIAVSSAYAYALTLMHVPEKVVAAFGTLAGNPVMVLLIINGILLLLGCFMETLGIMLLTVPILLPVVTQIGIDPVHFGVLMVLNLMIGQLTPPFGICLYCVSNVSKISVFDLVKEVWPFIVALLVVLLLITFIPSITMFLPNLMMK